MSKPVRITFMGGLGEIGRNCMALECEDQIVILDCGQLFPDASSPGMDAILPNFDFLRENADRIVGCIATHCHEDHIGGLPYALAEFEFPIYGTPFTLGMVRGKLTEAGLLDRTELIPVTDGDRRTIGPFDCEFIPVTHSTPMGLITSFTTPQGVILHSSDFKLDLTPVDGRRTDLSRIGAIADDPGVRLLMMDSTNADQPGQSTSERYVGRVIEQVIAEQGDQRLIFGAFSSHIHRIQQIADAVVPLGRTVVPLGLSMARNVKLARDLNILSIPDANIAWADDIEDLDPKRTVVVCTGSQGEPRSALSTMARGDNRFLQVGEGDTVIFSSHPIPGNEASVSRVRSGLLRRGVKVVHSGHVDVHTTGHGKRHELATLHSVASAEWFVPVHGEYEHLVAHVDLAHELGMDPDHVLLCEDGFQIEIDDNGVRHVGKVPGGHEYRHGRVGHLGEPIIAERQILGSDGFVAAYVVIDVEGRAIAHGPVVESRGWVDETGVALLDEAEDRAREAIGSELADLGSGDEVDLDALERVLRRAVGSFVSDSTGRRPMIVPVVSATR